MPNPNTHPISGEFRTSFFPIFTHPINLLTWHTPITPGEIDDRPQVIILPMPVGSLLRPFSVFVIFGGSNNPERVVQAIGPLVQRHTTRYVFDSLRSSLNLILEGPRFDSSSEELHRSKARGVTNIDLDVILLNGDYSYTALVETFAHEMAHALLADVSRLGDHPSHLGVEVIGSGLRSYARYLIEKEPKS